MTEFDFMKLGLKQGDLIHFTTNEGNWFSGAFDGEYNNSTGTFIFSNYSNGKTNIIQLSDLQNLYKINPLL